MEKPRKKEVEVVLSFRREQHRSFSDDLIYTQEILGIRTRFAGQVEAFEYLAMRNLAPCG
jgi:hypothetical protein